MLPRKPSSRRNIRTILRQPSSTDIRAFGKGFDQYYERAKSEYGVRYIKSFVSRILEDPATKDVEIVYVDESGDLKSEQFDLIVLSVGTRPSEHLSRLADVLKY